MKVTFCWIPRPLGFGRHAPPRQHALPVTICKLGQDRLNPRREMLWRGVLRVLRFLHFDSSAVKLKGRIPSLLLHPSPHPHPQGRLTLLRGVDLVLLKLWIPLGSLLSLPLPHRFLIKPVKTVKPVCVY